MSETHIISELRNRRSKVSFDPNYVLSESDLNALLEAARWAPSASNLQPWRWVIGLRGDATFARLLALLAPPNQAWAQYSSALIMTVAEIKRLNQAGETVTNRTAFYDTGMASMSLATEATHRGLNLRMMAGFSYDAAKKLFPDSLDPICVMALGKGNDGTHLPEDVAKRDAAPRARKDVKDLILQLS